MKRAVNFMWTTLWFHDNPSAATRDSVFRGAYSEGRISFSSHAFVLLWVISEEIVTYNVYIKNV